MAPAAQATSTSADATNACSLPSNRRRIAKTSRAIGFGFGLLAFVAEKNT